MDKLKKKRKKKRDNKRKEFEEKIINPMEQASRSIMSLTLRTGPIKRQEEKDTDLVQSMAASRVKLDDSLEEVDAKQNDAAEFLEDVRRLNPEKKSGATRTESPLARYKCSYNSKKKSKKSSLTKTAFGSLSVEAGIDNNHNPTQADRIVGAKKNR